MKHKYMAPWLCLAALAPVLPTTAQVQVNYKKYPDYTPIVKPDPSLLKSSVARIKGTTQRPERVNNAETKYFPPVFNQDGGSCGSASRIGYMFNYEINAYRGADASLEENQYPTHFTWLLTNSGSGKEGMAAANGIPNVPTYGGRTYSKLFGNQDTADPDFGWMQGYDKWYAAMFNRISRNANFPMSVETEGGREAVKNWIWNHNGDPDFKAGGICGIGVASGGQWLKIPKTEANDKNGVTNAFYVGKWGKQVDHALTIVGYDDRIEFDLDGNGIAGEKDKDEVGAWIVVNSWGNGWCNQGFIYCPYKNATPSEGNNGYYMPEIYYVRKDYRPLRTFKIKMDYSKRSELRINGGVSDDLNATEPSKLVAFEHFKFAGDGNNDGKDAEVPMLGKWADGIHSEPMEFGYDMTDLSASFDTRKPLKYFLVIESKGSADGKGTIHNCSLIDYEIDKKGIEFPFDIPSEGVSIKNKGNKTIISVVVPGEAFNAPRNLTLDAGTLTWGAPAKSSYTLVGYKVYKDQAVVKELDANTTTFNIDDQPGIYQVSAVYEFNKEKIESARTQEPIAAFNGAYPNSNIARQFNNAGFDIEKIFDTKYDQATIEFWLKPNSVSNWNQQMGPGWNRFMMHTTSAGEFVAGWDTGNRITTKPGTLKVGKWAHVAVVVDKNNLSVYIDGELAGSISSGYSGIGGFGKWTVGVNGNNGINGNMDEMRIWKSARSQKQIQNYMYAEIANVKKESSLLAEIKMNETEGKITDATGQYTITCFGNQKTQIDNLLLKDNRKSEAAFELPEGPYYTGCAIQIKNNSSANTVKWQWEVSGAEETSIQAENPTIIFNKEGKQTIKLTATDVNGKTIETVQEVQVQALVKPEPSFTISSEDPKAGERISFINTTTPSDGCSYKWTMEGANEKTAETRHAGATFDEAGTYTVTLTATNQAGTASVSQKITIAESTPEAQFDIQPSVVIKGDNISLKDQSKHRPTAWKWEITNPARIITVYNQNQTLPMNHPGVYQVKLTASNDEGSNSIIRERGVVVCNEDGKNGLNFTGNGESVDFKNPIKDKANVFSIEWWMYAKSNSVNCHKIGNSKDGFYAETDVNGTMTVYIKNQKASSFAGFVVPSEWHHYAITFSNGMVTFYRDGVAMGAERISVTKVSNMPENFQIGGKEAPMNAVIDEFRVWNRLLLNKNNILEYANNSIKDVSQEESKGLSLYYQFNQNSGDVQDATSAANHGKRTGFGPEGDAWSSSTGIFCLSEEVRTDITATYLKNYKIPFLSSSKTVNPQNSGRFKELQQNTTSSKWQLENVTEKDKVKTGFHVDSDKDRALTLTTTWDGFADKVENHKAFQTFKLPAGQYVFRIDSHKEFSAANTFMVVNQGTSLPDTKDSKTALAWVPLDQKEASFEVDQDGTTVSLGFVSNMSGKSCLTISRLYLEKKNGESYGEKPTDICNPEITEDTQIDVQVYPDGNVEIATSQPTEVTIYNISGTKVYQETVNGTSRMHLTKGIYIIGNKKIMIP